VIPAVIPAGIPAGITAVITDSRIRLGSIKEAWIDSYYPEFHGSMQQAPLAVITAGITAGIPAGITVSGAAA